MQAQDFNFTLSAGVPVLIPAIVGANFIAFVEGTNSIEISVSGGEYQSLLIGDVLESESLGEIERVYVKSAVSQSIKLKAGRGRYRTTVPVTISSVSSTIESADTLSTPGDVTATAAAGLLIAANANRKEVEIGVPDSAANGVRVGPAGVTAASGSYIAPGTSKFYANTAAFYVIRDGASNVDVYVLESEKP